MGSNPYRPSPTSSISFDASILCRYVNENGFDVIGFFLEGARIENPAEYRGAEIVGYIHKPNKVILKTTLFGELEFTGNARLTATNHGIRFDIVIIDLSKEENAGLTIAPIGLMVDPKDNINITEIIETAYKVCRV